MRPHASTVPLRLFFDTSEITDMNDWRFRLLGALKHSKMLLVCLSPNYFASETCRWEWEEYAKQQVHQLMGSESVATVYFIEVPGSGERANAGWLRVHLLTAVATAALKLETENLKRRVAASTRRDPRG